MKWAANHHRTSIIAVYMSKDIKLHFPCKDQLTHVSVTTRLLHLHDITVVVVSLRSSSSSSSSYLEYFFVFFQIYIIFFFLFYTKQHHPGTLQSLYKVSNASRHCTMSRIVKRQPHQRWGASLVLFLAKVWSRFHNERDTLHGMVQPYKNNIIHIDTCNHHWSNHLRPVFHF